MTSTVLDPEHHAKLIANLHTYAADAAIDPYWVETSLKTLPISDELLTWLKASPKAVRDHDTKGLVIVGHKKTSDLCSAIAGLFLRNYLRARVVTAIQLADGSPDYWREPTVVIVPNLQAGGASLAPWQALTAQDALMQRALANKMTIIAISDLNDFKDSTLRPVAEFVEHNYDVVSF